MSGKPDWMYSTEFDHQMAESMYAMNRARTEIQNLDASLTIRAALADRVERLRDELAEIRMYCDPGLKL